MWFRKNFGSGNRYFKISPVSVMCTWFVVLRHTYRTRNTITSVYNRLRWWVLPADVREHHCSLHGSLNWFSPGIHRQCSLNLLHTRYLKSKPLNYYLIVSIFKIVVVFWDWFMIKHLFVLCMKIHAWQQRSFLLFSSINFLLKWECTDFKNQKLQQNTAFNENILLFGESFLLSCYI